MNNAFEYKNSSELNEENVELSLLPEWSFQKDVLLTWPHMHSDWRDYLNMIEPTYIEIAAAIARFETLHIVCFDHEHLKHVKACLAQIIPHHHNIHYAVAPTNDMWIRDYGPLSVLDHVSQEIHLANFEFNAWGGKYAADLDNAVSYHLQEQNVFGHQAVIHHPFVLEGGSIETDGCGTLLTTEQCLLSPTRNPDFKRHEVEAYLTQTLGLDRFLWLKHGYLAGDDTDSHVDMLARFVNEETICYTACLDPIDEHFHALNEMANELRHFKTQTDKSYQLLPLPIPQPKYSIEGQRLPASYTNFLIINGAVLLPIYDDPHDQIAIDTLQQCFPNRTIIPILSTSLIHQFGSIHCATMQLA